jgi:hypothetical protein
MPAFMGLFKIEEEPLRLLPGVSLGMKLNGMADADDNPALSLSPPVPTLALLTVPAAAAAALEPTTPLFFL